MEGTDEKDCALCPREQFKCENGPCIPENKKCNGYPDCSDGSDERDCRKLIFIYFNAVAHIQSLVVNIVMRKSRRSILY